jgi:hypothetical protein
VRDTGLNSERSINSTVAQRLYLLNSSHIQNKLQNAGKIRRFLKISNGDNKKLITEVYLNIYSRFPSDQEMQTIIKYFQESNLEQKDVLCDLIWALINTKEFLFRH